MFEALKPWRLMGQAELDPNRAVDEPRLPCCSIVDPKIEMEADREAEEFAAENRWYVYSWPAVACLPDMAIAAVASISMQVVETILVVALAEELAQMGCIIVIMEMGKTEFLHGLAATLGMHTMMLQITPYRRTRAIHNMEVVETAVADGNQVQAREEWGYCVGDFRRLINHLDMQFVVTHIPKACTVLYQCFRLALSLAKEAAVPHHAEILSILCAFASFAPVLITVAQVELLYCTLVPLCERKDFKGPDGGHERRGYTDKQGKGMRPPIWLFRLAYAVACLFHLLAGAQIVMLLLGRRDLLPGAALFVSTD